VTEISVAVQFWRRVDTMMAQGRKLLRKFRQLLEGTNFRRPTLTFVAAGMRRRMDAIVPHGEPVVRTIRQLLGNLSRHKTLTFVVAGLVGLALILLLLEVSVTRQLANEASGAAIDTVPALSASAQKMDFGDVQRTGSISLQSADLSGVSRATPSSDGVQTFGQAFREPVPLPRPRKPR
jgi:hypothetical protein